MRMNYISRIQTNLKRFKSIRTNKPTSSLLDGSYNSVFKGRSMNFDELREYVPGDDIKDIDWKASSRSHKTLVRQYIAEKRHNIMLVMDTNRRMLAETSGSEEKKDAAIMAAGTLAFMVNHSGDYVSAVSSTENGISHFPFKNGLMNIEMILESYSKSVTMTNRTSINAALDFILHNFRRHMIIFIVTDLEGISEIDEAILKRLKVRNDILLININDSDISGKNVYDMNGDDYIPGFFTEDKKLIKLREERKQRLIMEKERKLVQYGIASISVDGSEDIDTHILELLNKHKSEMR